MQSATKRLTVPHYFKTYFIFAAMLFLAWPFAGMAQEFGGNPPSMKWRQIDTDTVRVIYPEPLEGAAQRVANLVMYMSRTNRRSIGDKQKKIDIVLQNQTVFSNGYVGLAPFRSELYMNAPQSGFEVGSNWLDMLTIHEYRHALQYVNLRRGLTKVGYYLMGQYGWSYFQNLSIPSWFFEGDAVVSETALTTQGRGRLPSFYNGYRGLVFDDRVYNYQKARNGSLKDFVPNRYELGYLLCNYGREEYGSEFWKPVIEDAGKYKGLFYPFSRAVKRHSGLNVKGLYENSMNFYRKNWEGGPDDSPEVRQINTKDKGNTFTLYDYPYVTDEGYVLAYIASFKRTGAIVKIDDRGSEKTVVRIGRIIDNYYAYRKGRLIWAELGQDVRWTWKTYSNIIVYDMATGNRKRLTHSQKYYSPDLSPDGKEIVAFHITPELKYRLHILAGDGSLLRELPNKENYFFSYPQWSRDGRHILVVARDSYGKSAILKVDPRTGAQSVLYPFTDHQFGIVRESADHYFFAASFTGIDNIFALGKSNGVLYQVTDGKLGSYHPVVDEEKGLLYFSRFSSMGNNLFSMSVNSKDWKPYKPVEPVDMEIYRSKSIADEGGDITGKIPGKRFETKKYPIGSHLINVHSWSFYFADPNYEWAIRSNNILNTLSAGLGVRYNRNENNFTYFADAVYAQYFPGLILSASTVQRSRLVNIYDQGGNFVRKQNVAWWETAFQPGVYIPLQLGSGLYDREMRVGTYYSLTSVKFKKYDDLDIKDYNIQSMSGDIAFVNRRIRAKQNIFPKWSQYMYLSYNTSIDRNTAGQWFFDLEWTFPGFFFNHNLVIQGAYKNEQGDNDYLFTDNFPYARGYSPVLGDEIYKVGFNYHFPVFYPDWGLWGIIYFYRLRGNAFFDYSRADYTNPETGNNFLTTYNSTGGELIIDTRMFNWYDFSFGFRYSRLLNTEYSRFPDRFEVFIPLMRF